MSLAIPKKTRVLAPKFLKFVDSMPCVISFQPATHHHLIGYGFGGMGTKADDYLSFPLSNRFHTGEFGIHGSKGYEYWESSHGHQVYYIKATLNRAFEVGVINHKIHKKYMNICNQIIKEL